MFIPSAIENVYGNGTGSGKWRYDVEHRLLSNISCVSTGSFLPSPLNIRSNEQGSSRYLTLYLDISSIVDRATVQVLSTPQKRVGPKSQALVHARAKVISARSGKRRWITGFDRRMPISVS